jgi:glutathione S-transferase
VPELVLHALPSSHPCLTVKRALALKGLEYELVDLALGTHNEEIERIYGAGRTTAPGMTMDGEPVHGSRAIVARLEQLAPEPALYPDDRRDAVLAAERWGDDELQDLGRRLPWGALHFRPESLGTFGGVGPLDGPGTDFAIRMIRGTWRYLGLTAERLHDDLAGLPEKLERIEQFAADGVIDGDDATAADLQIGATIRVLRTVGDLHEMLAGSAGERIAMRWFPDYPGLVPAGAYPVGWVPARREP